VVEERRSGNQLTRLRPKIRRSIPRSTPKSADQSRLAHAAWFSRNRELDGRRNSLARKSSAVEKDHKIIRARTHCDFPRDKVRRPQILANARPRFLRSARHLADPSKMETRRDLSDSPHTFAPRYCRRPHHSLVPKMSKIVAFTPLRER